MSPDEVEQKKQAALDYLRRALATTVSMPLKQPEDCEPGEPDCVTAAKNALDELAEAGAALREISGQ